MLGERRVHLDGIGGAIGMQPVTGQELRDELAQLAVVIDDQDAGRAGFGAHGGVLPPPRTILLLPDW